MSETLSCINVYTSYIYIYIFNSMQLYIYIYMFTRCKELDHVIRLGLITLCNDVSLYVLEAKFVFFPQNIYREC